MHVYVCVCVCVCVIELMEDALSCTVCCDPVSQH